MRFIWKVRLITVVRRPPRLFPLPPRLSFVALFRYGSFPGDVLMERRPRARLNDVYEMRITRIHITYDGLCFRARPVYAERAHSFGSPATTGRNVRRTGRAGSEREKFVPSSHRLWADRTTPYSTLGWGWDGRTTFSISDGCRRRLVNRRLRTAGLELQGQGRFRLLKTNMNTLYPILLLIFKN